VTDPALELRGITKRFGSVVALNGAEFVLQQGEVHGLLGENGAGKSTLMHVAYGLVRPDRGTIRVNGQDVAIGSPRDARRLSIGMVHQHFTSIPTLTVRENLWLAAGRYGSPKGGAPPAATNSLAAKLWEGLDPRARVESLPVAAKQRLEILQALATDARILLLDEPTAVLTPAEIEELLALLRSFAAEGGAVVIITHKLDEILSAAARVTVLRRGATVLSGATAGETRESLARSMIGDEGAAPLDRRASVAQPPVATTLVKVRGLEARAGEVVGIAAVEGNGQRPLLRSIAGLEPLAPDGIAEGPVAFIPEDRSTEGLIPSFGLAENLVLGLPADPRWRDGQWLRWKPALARTEELIAEFRIRAAGASVPARTLSGGNQQKLVFARAVESRPRVVVAENPTRGLDVQATAFVHERLRRLAKEGAAVIVYSTDLDEVMAVADRVFVVRANVVTEAPSGADRRRIGAMMLGAVE
jgi:simple sugar transport system ATP-binding protein